MISIDLCKFFNSLSDKSTDILFSTPFAPTIEGAPKYSSLSVFSPLFRVETLNLYFLSFRIESEILAITAPIPKYVDPFLSIIQ